jgi:GNAT superfamily N-acetyltransferase
MGAELDLMDERTLAALDANYIACNGVMMSHSPTGEFSERRESALLCCGAPIAEFNRVRLKAGARDPEAGLDRARRYFGERQFPYCVELMRSSMPDYQAARDIVTAAGFEATVPPTPGMALAPIPDRPAQPAELTIERVCEPEVIQRFGVTAVRGFGFPEQAAPMILSRRFLDRPEVQAFIGSVDGEAVATSLLFISGYVAGIYFVATRADARRRGYGEALTWAAAEAGRAAGCTVASLQASAMGRPVYARMGFAHVIDYERYERVAPTETAANTAPP